MNDSDSTATSLDEITENFYDNPTREILAEGIVSLFKPTIDHLDERVRLTRSSQEELGQTLDALFIQLKELEKNQAHLPDYSTKITKLAAVRKKVNIISNILHSCQDRLNELYKNIEKEQATKKIILQAPDTQ